MADAEAGFGGPLNAFELMKAMIEAGAAGVHFEDQLASEKKCGHMGGKVLVPASQFVRTLVAARLAADVMGVSTILVARTDADSGKIVTADIDSRDKPFLTGQRSPEGFQPRPRLPAARNERVLGAATGRVRSRKSRLHGHTPPTRSRYGLLRPSRQRLVVGLLVDARPARLDRSPPVLITARGLTQTQGLRAPGPAPGPALDLASFDRFAFERKRLDYKSIW